MVSVLVLSLEFLPDLVEFSLEIVLFAVGVRVLKVSTNHHKQSSGEKGCEFLELAQTLPAFGAMCLDFILPFYGPVINKLKFQVQILQVFAD